MHRFLHLRTRRSWFSERSQSSREKRKVRFKFHLHKLIQVWPRLNKLEHKLFIVGYCITSSLAALVSAISCSRFFCFDKCLASFRVSLSCILKISPLLSSPKYWLFSWESRSASFLRSSRSFSDELVGSIDIRRRVQRQQCMKCKLVASSIFQRQWTQKAVPVAEWESEMLKLWQKDNIFLVF